MSRKLADATSRFLAKRSPRRGFLAKTAVVGSAMAVAPKQFITRPATAYAQVCNCNGSRCKCSQLCCDGYTEFCCTIYGTNGCPPGSLYGGWWRVSGSNYCGGSNRYYLDCHNPCGDCGCGASGICSGGCNGTACGCALGSCKNRKAGCTHFRYGQCNQQEKCLGPIVCRVITCTPPWQLEPNCTRSVRTDEATRNHNRACLTASTNAPEGAVDAVEGLPGAIRVQGWAIDPDRLGPIDVTVSVNGTVVTSGRADQSRPDIGIVYSAHGPDHGFDMTFPATLGTKEICIHAVNAGGGRNTLLGCQRVRVRATAPTGVIEAATGDIDALEINGWALIEGSREPLDVDLYVNDDHVETVAADKRRRDLREAFGEAGTRHGFKKRLRAEPGRHQVCARTVDPETGETVDLGCVTVDVLNSASPEGGIDKIRGRAESIRVVGWAFDPDGGDAEVVVMVDGTEAGRAICDQGRPDLESVFPDANDTGGFDIRLPASAGDHNVCVYSFGSDGDPGPLLGCRNVTVG